MCVPLGSRLLLGSGVHGTSELVARNTEATLHPFGGVDMVSSSRVVDPRFKEVHAILPGDYNYYDFVYLISIYYCYCHHRERA